MFTFLISLFPFVISKQCMVTLDSEEIVADLINEGYDVVPDSYKEIGNIRYVRVNNCHLKMDTINATSGVQNLELDVPISGGYSWGIDRINQRDLPLDFKYSLDEGFGQNTVIYVIDSGINIDHPEFEGRAKWGPNFVGDGQDYDCANHGTFVAGIAGGSNVGVAPGTILVSLKVLGCSNTGSFFDIIDAIVYVVEDCKNYAGKKCIINLSIQGGFFSLVNNVINQAVDLGIAVAVCSANFNNDACLNSPASAEKALTVAASTITDDKASFSSFGECVDLWAPGLGVNTSCFLNNYCSFSGCSGATPHVAGGIARLWSQNMHLNSTEIQEKLLGIATYNTLNLDDYPSTPNILLWVNDSKNFTIPTTQQPVTPAPIPRSICQECLEDNDCSQYSLAQADTSSGIDITTSSSSCGPYCNNGKCSSLKKSPQVCNNNDWECGNSFPECQDQNYDNLCLCDLDIEGNPFCWEDSSCSGLKLCSSSSECKSNEACVTTCCFEGQSHCIPECLEPLTSSTTTPPKTTTDLSTTYLPENSDPLCLTGLRSGLYCCHIDCGKCGGVGCSTRPGGPENCCLSDIDPNRSCAFHLPPCKMDPFQKYGPDPTCQNGIIKNRVCCDSHCKRCGGMGCSSVENGPGSDWCCVSDILENNVSCSETSAPCVI